MVPRQEAIALIVINLAGAQGARPPSIAGSIEPPNQPIPARTDGHQCDAQRDTQNENWQTAIAGEWLRKDTVYEGTDISGLRKKGPRRAAKADNCRADRRDC
jgi:hypothetical protein